MEPPSRSGPAFEPFEPREPLSALEPGDPPLIGGYRVLARLTEGRLGPVYLAATQSGRRLAIKSVRPELAEDAAFRRRLKQRIAAAQRARGPYLATVVDGHAEGACPWVATEYVPGPTLARAVAESGTLPVPAVRALFRAVAEALQAVHDADIVHGDLKPSNVLLAAGGPRVVDFGSPEREAGAPGDVYALGRLVLFAATGSETSIPPLDWPEELRGPIERCLAEDPAERPEPRALAAELEEEPPGPDWPPLEIAALLPAYEADPPRKSVSPVSMPPPAPAAPPAPATQPDVPATAAERRASRPNFAVPPRPPATEPIAVPAPAGPAMQPVMGTYRHDLVVALGIGGGAFGLLVLVLLLVFLV